MVLMNAELFEHWVGAHPLFNQIKADPHGKRSRWKQRTTQCRTAGSYRADSSKKAPFRVLWTVPEPLVRMRSPVRIRAAAPNSPVSEWKLANFCFILDYSSVVKNADPQADPLDEMRKQHRLDRIGCPSRCCAVLWLAFFGTYLHFRERIGFAISLRDTGPGFLIGSGS